MPFLLASVDVIKDKTYIIRNLVRIIRHKHFIKAIGCLSDNFTIYAPLCQDGFYFYPYFRMEPARGSAFSLHFLKALRTSRLHFAVFAVKIQCLHAETKTQSAQRKAEGLLICNYLQYSQAPRLFYFFIPHD